MLEKFKLFYNTLTKEQKIEAIKYIRQDAKINSISEGLFTGPTSNETFKGLNTGPVNISGKCPTCGK